MVAVRDLQLAGLGDAETWFNSHIVYTHGYGLVAAAGNQRSVDGQPVFLQSGIPSTGSLGEFEPRVYFGEDSPAYSIVGAPEGADPVELDYPAGGESEQQTQTTFKGDGGPKLDNVFTKLVYALKFQSEQIFLSDAVNTDSQILYDRDPIERVKKVAPYLTLDSDTYPSVVDGRIVWVVDGYTLTDQYPYSNKVSMSEAIADSESLPQSLPFDEVNYIRNSVKATVDAYDGSVKLYAWDDEDPILQTWNKIFPTTLEPMSEMSGDLLSHVRYPADLFKIQRAVLGRYHVTDPGSFYSREDAWTTPKDPTAGANTTLLQPPYYLTMQMPGQDAPSYSLYSTFIPEARGDQSRNVLRGYLAVDADAGATDGEKAEGYGKLRLLTLPEDDNVPGPGQVQAKFNSDPTVSQSLNLLKQGQSDVINGNLLTVPVGGGLLYVQPVYVKSTGNTSYPVLQKVLVAFGDQIAFQDTLDLALDVLFGGDSGADAGDNAVDPGATPTEPPDRGHADDPRGPERRGAGAAQRGEGRAAEQADGARCRRLGRVRRRRRAARRDHRGAHPADGADDDGAVTVPVDLRGGDWLDDNRANWDERVPLHVASDFYHQEPLRRGEGVLDPIARAGIERMHPDGLDGLRVLHLQCHFGSDTLSLANRGATVVGLDFSRPAVEEARRVAAELGIADRARFVEANLYDARHVLPEPGVVRPGLHDVGHHRLAPRCRGVGAHHRVVPQAGRAALLRRRTSRRLRLRRRRRTRRHAHLRVRLSRRRRARHRRGLLRLRRPRCVAPARQDVGVDASARRGPGCAARRGHVDRRLHRALPGAVADLPHHGAAGRRHVRLARGAMAAAVVRGRRHRAVSPALGAPRRERGGVTCRAADARVVTSGLGTCRVPDRRGH